MFKAPSADDVENLEHWRPAGDSIGLFNVYSYNA